MVRRYDVYLSDLRKRCDVYVATRASHQRAQDVVRRLNARLLRRWSDPGDGLPAPLYYCHPVKEGGGA